MYYYIYGTSPKEYKEINSDVEVTDFIKVSNDNLRAEIVITIQEVEGLDVEVSEFNHNDVNLSAPTLCYKDIAVGTYFPDALSFKHALRSVAIKENFGVRVKASDKKRVIATCSYQGCKWRIRASLCDDAQSFEVRRLDGEHTCPDIPPKEINNNLEKEYGLSLPYMKLWRSREQAHDNIFGCIDDNYKWVPTLQAELIGRNPGSHITYTYDERDNSFQRFYVSFKVCADGFKYGCRPLISLDACHLKSKHLGMLLSATSLDGNNGLFPLGFVVVENESKQTWLWFLHNLGESIGIEIEPLAFISDMEKGLGEAIREVYPGSEHRICIHGHKLQGLVWAAANAYSRTEYNNKLVELSVLNQTIHAYLIYLPYKWSRSQFMPGIYHSTNMNNFAESFNAWIVDARTKHVVDLIDLIRAKLMEQRTARKMASTTWNRELVPHAEEYIREITTRIEHLLCFRYRLAYDGAIAALPGKDQWQVVHDVVELGVPNTSRPRGRPKRKRLPNFLEKEKKVHKCSRCGLWGHHRSTCKNPLKSVIDDKLLSQVCKPKRAKLPTSWQTPYAKFLINKS
ncbi:hypothetical protein M5K25_001749 [Dendrobium thyrsiflorum]|uniref:Transposase n=1 Tax=Dendrobium thyrsiflorum TaxID=117978 RepID=A0ABD0VZ95_DENTH